MKNSKTALIEDHALNSSDFISQNFEGETRGEYRLLAAVLGSALHDIKTGSTIQKYRAYAWFNSTKTNLFSFLSICEYLDINATNFKKLTLEDYYKEAA